MIRSLVKQVVKRVLRVQTRPAEYQRAADVAQPPTPVAKAAPPPVASAPVVSAPVVSAPVVSAPPVAASEPPPAVVAEAAPSEAPVAMEAEAVSKAPAGKKAKKGGKSKAKSKKADPDDAPSSEVVLAPPEPAPVEVAVSASAEVFTGVAVTDARDDTAGPALALDAVQAILDDMVRPALQGDGGDITLLRIEDNDIYVKLVGSCSSCPSSIMTMKMGVEALLREEFPVMRQLIQED